MFPHLFNGLDHALFLLELKNILDMLQLENSELQALKLQHDQKMSELEKIHAEVLEVIDKGISLVANLTSPFVQLSPPLSSSGETGVGELATGSPATERGDGVAEAALRAGQAGG